MRNMLNVNVVTVKKPLKRRQARSATGATAASCSPDRCSVLQHVAACCTVLRAKFFTLGCNTFAFGPSPGRSSQFGVSRSPFRLPSRPTASYRDLRRPTETKKCENRLSPNRRCRVPFGYWIFSGAWCLVMGASPVPFRPRTPYYGLIQPNTPYYAQKNETTARKGRYDPNEDIRCLPRVGGLPFG